MQLSSAYSLLLLTASTLVGGINGTFICDNQDIEFQTIDDDVLVAPNAFCNIKNGGLVRGNVKLQEGSDFSVKFSGKVEGKVIAKKLGSGKIEVLTGGTVGEIFVKKSTLAGLAIDDGSIVNGDMVITDQSTIQSRFRIEEDVHVTGSLVIDEDSTLDSGLSIVESTIDGVVDIFDSTINRRLEVLDSTICTKGDNGFKIVGNVIDKLRISKVDIPGLVGEASHIFEKNSLRGNALFSDVNVAKDLIVKDNTIDATVLNITAVDASKGKVEVKNNEVLAKVIGSSRRKKNLRKLATSFGAQIALQSIVAEEMKVEGNKLVSDDNNFLSITGNRDQPSTFHEKLVLKKNELSTDGTILISDPIIGELLQIEDNVVGEEGFVGSIIFERVAAPRLRTTNNQVQDFRDEAD